MGNTWKCNKTLDKGRKFKCERYRSAYTLYTKWGNEHFYVKCECKASMKKENKRVTVKLNSRNGKAESGSCTCPAGNSFLKQLIILYIN